MIRYPRFSSSTLTLPPSRLGLTHSRLPLPLSEPRTRSFIFTNSPNSPLLSNLFQSDITGTTPFHTSYVLLQHPDPPKLYPAKLDKSFSPLGRALTVATAQRRGVANFWYDSESEPKTEREVENRRGTEDGERYPMMVFGTDRLGRNVLLEGRQEASSDATFTRDLESSLSLPTYSRRRISLSKANEEYDVLLLICTHGARDCRCGDTGGELVRVLRKEIEARVRNGRVGSPRVKVGEVAHIGGHKYAACSIVFPFGDWLGNLRPSDGPRILDHIDEHFSLYQKQLELQGGSDRVQQLPPLIKDRKHWRGRIGLTKEEQIELIAAHAQ